VCVNLRLSSDETSLRTARIQLTQMRPDVLLTDLQLPDGNGIELTESIGKLYPGLPCVMLSGHHDHAYVRRALDAGARGYILKGDPQEIAEAILRVLDGEIYVSRAVQTGNVR
jgi:DNA-binding NarL/FixJ family response regulator